MPYYKKKNFNSNFHKPGIVYILSHPYMQGLLKIGQTTRSVSERINELYLKNTSMPAKFKCEYSIKTTKCGRLEKIVHKKLDFCRENKYREFFNIPLQEAISVLNECHQKMEADILKTLEKKANIITDCKEKLEKLDDNILKDVWGSGMNDYLANNDFNKIEEIEKNIENELKAEQEKNTEELKNKDEGPPCGCLILLLIFIVLYAIAVSN